MEALYPIYPSGPHNPGQPITYLSVLADKAEESGYHELANLYRKMLEDIPTQEEAKRRTEAARKNGEIKSYDEIPVGDWGGNGLPHRGLYNTGAFLHYSGHHSVVIPGDDGTTFVQHSLVPLTDGRVVVGLHASIPGVNEGKSEGGRTILSLPETERLVHALSSARGASTTYPPRWYWKPNSPPNYLDPNYNLDNERWRSDSAEVNDPIPHLRNAVEGVTGKPLRMERSDPLVVSYERKGTLPRKLHTQGSDMTKPITSRRRYAARAQDIVREPPMVGGVAGAKWGAFKGKPPDRTWHNPSNPDLYPSLHGTRLAVVLHEIRDHIGQHDPYLAQLADHALKGHFLLDGRDVFTEIRDVLARHGRTTAVGTPREMPSPLVHDTATRARAAQLAREYNWHRVHAGIKLDRVVSAAVKSMAKRGKFGGTGMELRAAHNAFGIGSEDRGHDPGKKKAFLTFLRKTVKESLLGASGGRDPAALHAPDMTDDMLLRSIRRLAEAEENIHRLREVSGRSKVYPGDLESYEGQFGRPAYSVTKKGPRVSPGAPSGQYKRTGLLRKYSLFANLFGGGEKSPSFKAILHESHPGGRYDPQGHFKADAEAAAVRHGLHALGVIPPREPGIPQEGYTSFVNQLVQYFMDRARRYIQANPDDVLSRFYKNAASRLSDVGEGETEYEEGWRGRAGEVKRTNLDEPGDPASILGLSVGITPILRMFAEHKGLLPRRGVYRPTPPADYPELPPEPGEVPSGEEPIDLAKYDLTEAYKPEDMERIASEALGGEESTREPFGSEPPLEIETPGAFEVVHDATPEDFTLPEVDLGEPLPEIRAPRVPRGVSKEIHQAIADHMEGAFARGETSAHKAGRSAAAMLRERFGFTPHEAQKHLSNYLRLKAAPAPSPEPKTSRVWPPTPRRDRLSRKKFSRPNPIEGGVGDDLEACDVDPGQLAMGTKVEMEHTKDRAKARDIAFDHLKEDPSYYTKLKKVEKAKYAAYRAPAGGMVARGTMYKGGEMVPDMEGRFMNPPKSFDPAKMGRLRKKYKTMSAVMDEGTLGTALPGSSVKTKKLSRRSLVRTQGVK